MDLSLAFSCPLRSRFHLRRLDGRAPNPTTQFGEGTARFRRVLAGEPRRRLGDGGRRAPPFLVAAPAALLLPSPPGGPRSCGIVAGLDHDWEFGRRSFGRVCPGSHAFDPSFFGSRGSFCRISKLITDADLRDLMISLEGNLEENERWEDVIEKSSDLVSYKAKCFRPRVCF
ncbi:hypothetical protein B296_00021983 [Ensete ventricosum]|uniref:START domain-containing protein n=1 Tax=Ensete ventricosum TaxID=4639 RepID=A0A427AAK7_ENSVE|nr:hypothetical protein B296_00021983 [Ensete ventricosum]